MNKYQKAYELECEHGYIIDLILDKYPEVQMDIMYDKRYEKIIEKIKSFEKKYKHLPCGIIQKLVNQTKAPTLKEVKKAWKALGYEWTRTENAIFIEKGNNSIVISLTSKTYGYHLYNDLEYRMLPIKEHQLLTKTFRALGWIK